MNHQYREIKILSVLILIFTVVFMYTRYATVDDFIFSNLIYSVEIMNNGIIDRMDPFPGFSLLVTNLAYVTGCELITIVALPLLAPCLFFTIYSILKKMNMRLSKTYIIIISIIFILNFGMRPVLFTHMIGLNLFFTIVLLTILKLNNNYIYKSEYIMRKLSICMIIIFLSLNFISYKIIILSLLFLVGVQISLLIENNRLTGNNKVYNNFYNIILIAIIVSLSFNWIYYRGFIPAIREINNGILFGISKLFSINNMQANSPLSQFYYTANQNNILLYILLYLILLVSLIYIILTLINNIIKHQSFSISELIIIGMLFSSGSILLIYSLLGLADVSYLLMTAVISLVIIPSKRNIFNNIPSKKIMLSMIIVALILSISINIVVIPEKNYGGQTDKNEFYYLHTPIKWSFEYIPNNYDRSSDILTYGYYQYLLLIDRNSNTSIIHPFSENELLSIFYNNSSTYQFYLINYRENRFNIMNWISFNSWSNYKGMIVNNSNIQIIYNSGSIDILY